MNKITICAALFALSLGMAAAVIGCGHKCYDQGFDDCMAGVYLPTSDCNGAEYDEGWLAAGCRGGGDTGDYYDTGYYY